MLFAGLPFMENLVNTKTAVNNVLAQIYVFWGIMQQKSADNQEKYFKYLIVGINLNPPIIKTANSKGRLSSGHR